MGKKNRHDRGIRLYDVLPYFVLGSWLYSGYHPASTSLSLSVPHLRFTALSEYIVGFNMYTLSL